MLHRGHMRLARPPLDGTGASRLQDMVQSVGPCGDTPALGWEFFLDRAGGDADTAPGEVSRSCRCCRATRLKTPARPRLVGSHSPPYLDSEDMSYARVGSVLPRVALAFEEREAANGYLDLPGRELILQEVCAGTAGITKAWRRLGLLAEEPIELYEDPERRSGPRAEHDVTRSEVQKRLLRAAADPHGPNVWIIEPPCTSYCDFLLWSGGTRTFHCPHGGSDGQPLTNNEEVGNQISDFMARLLKTLLKNKK